MSANMADEFPDRHQATRNILQHFTDGRHLTNPDARQISVSCSRLAVEMTRRLSDGPELTAGLRKLLEAKDCFVRQVISPGG